MNSPDGLFDVPAPEHPDAAVARQEITAYYEERVAEARAALAEAQAQLDAREREQTAWVERGEITGNVVGRYDLEVLAISGRATGRYMKAAKAAIDNRGNRDLAAAAEAVAERDKALRRWLTARGFELGEMALPAPAKPGRR